MQNKNNKSNKIAAAMFFLIIAFVFGLFVGAAAKENAKATTKVVEKKVGVVTNEEAWRELKTTDDKVIKLAITQTELCSAALYAIGNKDDATLGVVSKEIEKNRAEFKAASDERVQATKALGY